MGLTVVTLTRGDRPQWEAECEASVQRWIPEGGRHAVVFCEPSDFQRMRWNATVTAGTEFVAWVDDDDRVCNDALRLCVQALQETGAGVAFTHEARIDEHGEVTGTFGRPCLLRDVALHPRVLHHLAVIRRECLAPEVLEHAERIGIGIDWLMRAWCALKHGAVQVPVVGYEWRNHPGATSQSAQWAADYAAAIPALREVALSWMSRNAPIPRYLPR